MQGQTNCQLKDDTIHFERIFGDDHLWAYGADTLVINKNRQVIYFCEQCKLTCSNKHDKLMWTIDLSELKCGLLYLGLYKHNTRKKIKGGDIILQDKNKIIYALNSKNGKIIPLNGEDLIKYTVFKYTKIETKKIVKSMR